MHISRTEATFCSPIVESRRWTEGVTFPPSRPLINVSQAAPADPPPMGLRQAIADAALNETDAHLYGAVLGRSELRAALAAQISEHYDGTVGAAQVGITSGCNQAFAAAIAALCGEGDEVIIPVPWYFNHKMCLDMAGVKAVPLPVGADMMPDPQAAAQLITPKTRAITLVTPNNPTGAEYPSGLVQAFFDLARKHGLALILDETYRDFDSREGAPHDLFQTPNWDETLIHLYSFSKAYRLTGHRVGAIASSEEKLFEMEKFLDTITICPAQLGQIGAHWGLENLQSWLAGERLEILDRKAAIEEEFPRLAEKGWKLLGCGAYFAYVEHPFEEASSELAKKLVQDASILMLPGTMFMPEGDPAGSKQFRIAFANVDRAGIVSLFDRLCAFHP
ncbi:aminotransferase [Phaeobacter gallaeciensis]|uniref:aminotransferase n=1 Tax=Phaeobacter gallaeciensis TaxID=60890 RepID=UPI00237FD121|nr:aminotransferase [Phaeobacter gallaeciensis]MDE4096341.1 aminotransferase [Phaeobacter gallaeciensis]MDE4105152.1 aminotransferase [Phaeobacter gallaeciensis]MDE4109608.1 aminotransferase [Phaeobacter gallaeciensis]MDE4114076.1 aminotransferase [Phaeobacter gallaeciensis]MDE4118543.1 aminotransferase [Phaeobacter gallaeciensis]